MPSALYRSPTRIFASRVAVFFVASPLHYLAARRVALDHEPDARCVLLYYDRLLEPVVRPADWDAALYIPWPRLEPLSGPFGRRRRLLENLRCVAAAVGRTQTLVVHGPVFDIEAIDYVLRALPRMTGADTMLARVLPDGLLDLQRHPPSRSTRRAQPLRALRRLVGPWFGDRRLPDDRTGSDAPFVDRIYVLAGFPHRYDPQRTVTLGPLEEVASDG